MTAAAARSKRYRTRQALGLRVYKIAANERDIRTILTRTNYLAVGAGEEDIPHALEKMIADMIDGEVQ